MYACCFSGLFVDVVFAFLRPLLSITAFGQWMKATTSMPVSDVS